MTTTVIKGCMFAGKTSELLLRHSQADADLGSAAVGLIGHAMDNRYKSGCVCSHNGDNYPAHITSALMSADTLEYVAGKHIIFVDEGCFYADLLAFAAHCRYHSISLVVCGLDYMASGAEFGQILALARQPSVQVVQLFAKCDCGDAAIYTGMCSGQIAISGIRVGGGDIYSPKCEKCFSATGSGLISAAESYEEIVETNV